MATPARAAAITDLPDMSLLTPYAVFGYGVNLNLATVNGDVGIANRGVLTISQPSSITGDVTLGTGATLHNSGTIGGTTSHQDMTAAKAQVLSASQTLAGLAPDYTLASLTTTHTFNAVGDVTVIDIGTIGGSGNVVLSGSSSDVFVINVSGAVSFTGSTGVSGIDASRVLFNLDQNLTNGACSTSHDFGTVTHINDVLNATTLIPCNSATFHSVNGAIFANNTGTITLMSGAHMTQVPFSPPSPPTVPEPATLTLFGTGLALVAGRRNGRQRRIEL